MPRASRRASRLAGGPAVASIQAGAQAVPAACKPRRARPAGDMTCRPWSRRGGPRAHLCRRGPGYSRWGSAGRPWSRPGVQLPCAPRALPWLPAQHRSTCGLVPSPGQLPLHCLLGICAASLGSWHGLHNSQRCTAGGPAAACCMCWPIRACPRCAAVSRTHLEAGLCGSFRSVLAVIAVVVAVLLAAL